MYTRSSQAELLEQEVKAQMFIHGHFAQNGYPPTLREIAEELMLPDHACAGRVVKRLEAKGIIYCIPDVARGIRLWFQKPDAKPQRKKPTQLERRLQVYARSFAVRYGFPPSAEQIADGLGMDRKLARKVLQVMKDEGVRL